MTAIEAAHMEVAGRGTFSIKGRKIIFRTNEGVEAHWSAASTKEATDLLRVFRAAPKYTTCSIK